MIRKNQIETKETSLEIDEPISKENKLTNSKEKLYKQRNINSYKNKM